METDEYRLETLIINSGKGQIVLSVYFILYFLLFDGLYLYRWPEKLNWATLGSSSHHSNTTLYWLIPLLLIAGVLLHEFLHGFIWGMYAKGGLKAIRFGFIWKWLSPYCHCTEPLSKNAFIFGTLFPGVLLGFGLSVFAIINGSILAIFFGLVLTLKAGSDFTVFYLVRKQPKNYLFQDHPTEMGCYLYKPLKRAAKG